MRRNGLFVDGEGPAESAALVGSIQFAELNSANRGQQLPHLVECRCHQLAGRAQPQLAMPVATVVQPDAVREIPFHPLDVEHVREELAQLERLVLEFLKTVQALQVLVVMVPHHRDATARRADHVFVVLEDPQELDGQRAGVFRAARVGHRLPAASLLEGKLHLDALLLQHFDRRHSDVGVQLIDVTGDEKPDLHRRTRGAKCLSRNHSVILS